MNFTEAIWQTSCDDPVPLQIVDSRASSLPQAPAAPCFNRPVYGGVSSNCLSPSGPLFLNSNLATNRAKGESQARYRFKQRCTQYLRQVTPPVRLELERSFSRYLGIVFVMRVVSDVASNKVCWLDKDRKPYVGRHYARSVVDVRERRPGRYSSQQGGWSQIPRMHSMRAVR